MDADYLKNTVGLVVARACSAVVAAEPPDPIAYLSLWLLKYIQNVSILDNFHEEKRMRAEMEKQSEHKLKEAKLQEELEESRRKAAIDNVRNIKDDPYLLWDACLNAISTFTGSSSSYIAVVIDKLWIPNAFKAKEDNLDEEQFEGDGEGSQNEAEEEQEEEVNKETEDEGQEQGENINNNETRDAEHVETSEGENITTSMENVKRPPKPPNYKKKTLVYVSATSNNKFMLNMSADRKLVPVSYEVLTRGIQQLHVANALYKEGMHFFGGIPRVGAYFVVPITLKTAPPQVAALLCADTLKVERYGTGRPFSESDVIFITAIADSISDVMNANHSKITNKPMTEVLIKKIQVQLQQIKDQREETLKKAIADTKALQRLSKLEVQGNNQGDDDKEHKDDEELDEGKDEVEEGQEEGEEDEVEEEEEMAEDDAKAEDEEEEQEEEEEVDPEEGEDAIKDRRKLYFKDLRKEIAKYRKKVTIAEKNCEKLKNAIEIRGQKVGRLEVKLSKSKDYIQHFQNLLAIVIETIIEVKETEQPQILCWPFPSTNIFRILKGVLHILGYTKEIVENWVKVREIIKTSFYNELEHYDASQEKDLVKWNFGDKCIDDLSDEKLVNESPIGYLGKQWLVLVKDLTVARIKHQNLKERCDNASKVVADVELESMVAELEVKALLEELSKMMNKEKELMDVMKVAKEQKGPNETNDFQNRDNVSKENDEEGEEEEDVEEDNGE